MYTVTADAHVTVTRIGNAYRAELTETGAVTYGPTEQLALACMLEKMQDEPACASQAARNAVRLTYLRSRGRLP